MSPSAATALNERLFVILVRPESLENIGLVARAMKNTGFRHLRVVGRKRAEIASPRTAIHAKEIIRAASFFPDLAPATGDLDVVFASTAKQRKNFSVLPLEEAVVKMLSFSSEVKIGLLFGNERTGLTSAELAVSNFRWSIPQASRQPSYNLAAAVLITLFELFRRGEMGTVLFPSNSSLKPTGSKKGTKMGQVLNSHDSAIGPPGTEKEKIGPSHFSSAFSDWETPLPRGEQEGCIRLILEKLERRGFIHPTNKRHTSQMVRDLLGRLAMTDRDRKLLLAMFSHAGRDAEGV
ncbi:MAG: RNA methyltransferase [Candidatus Aminicenantes bacterium]|nr:RNA methyltransferase [Candidatus Aminicenantes bacterium]